MTLIGFKAARPGADPRRTLDRIEPMATGEGLWRPIAGICVLGAFLLVQAIAIAGMACAIEASLDGHLLRSDVLIAFSIFWGSMPLVIGGVWVYRLWLPILRPSPSTRGERRRNVSSAAKR